MHLLLSVVRPGPQLRGTGTVSESCTLPLFLIPPPMPASLSHKGGGIWTNRGKAILRRGPVGQLHPRWPLGRFTRLVGTGTLTNSSLPVPSARPARSPRLGCSSETGGPDSDQALHIRADAAEAAVIEHLASHTAPPELVTLTREQLRQLRHIPDQAASVQRGRLEAAVRRLNEMYMWQTVSTCGEYQHQRAELTTKLAEMPPPVESNLLAFDSAASRLLPMGGRS